jgi:serine/threonine protein kinase
MPCIEVPSREGDSLPRVKTRQHHAATRDWWAFGVLIYQMSFRQSPFRGEDEDEIYDAILDGEPSYPSGSPPSALDICQRLLKSDPEQRLGSGPEDAREVIVHHYFTGIHWDDLYHKRTAVPYKPTVSGDKDISNFDPELTRFRPVLVPAPNGLYCQQYAF